MNKTQIKKILNEGVRDYWKKDSEYLFVMTNKEGEDTILTQKTSLSSVMLYRVTMVLLSQLFKQSDSIPEVFFEAFKEDLVENHTFLRKGMK